MRLSCSNPVRYLLISFLGCSLVACLAGRETTVRGVLHGALVWQGEVFVAGDVILADDADLTIYPGTRVRFLPPDAGPGGLVDHPHFPGSELIIQGKVTAIGSPSAPIVFEAYDAAAQPGFWGAINLEESPRALFAYCFFRQADSAIHSRDSKVSIRQSVFEDNLVGVRFNNSDIQVEHNLLRNNHTAIRFHFGSPLILANEFQNNRINIFISSHPRDYLVESNSFGEPAEYHVVLGEEVPEDVLLAHNYWWLPTLGGSVFERIYDGRRSPYLGRVRIDPPLTAPPSSTGLSWSP